MKLFILTSVLIFTVGPMAAATEYASFDPAEVRLNECMSILKTPLNESFQADVVRVGPSLRTRVRDLRNAIVIMTHKTSTGATVVLRPIKDKGLIGSRVQPVEIESSSVLTLELTDFEFAMYQRDSHLIGTIDLSFGKSEKSLRTRAVPQVRADNIDLGAVLMIDGKYFVVVNRGSGSYSEHGVARSHRTDVLTLAAFSRKPEVDGASLSKPQYLQFGGHYSYALNGQQVKSISDIGKAIIDVHQRIGGKNSDTFASTIVNIKWSDNAEQSDPSVAAAVKARNFQQYDHKANLVDAEEN